MLSSIRSFSLVIMLGILLTACSLFPATTEIFVSPTGDDSAAGTSAAPIATLQKAADMLKDNSKDRPVTIWLSGGVYRITEPMELGIEHGGSESAPVSWKAIPGEKPIISGGVKITGWKKENDGIWSAPLPSNMEEVPRELFVNNKRSVRARFPNSGYMRIDRAGDDNRTNFFFKKNDFPKVEDINSLELILIHDWSISRIGVKNIDWNNNHLLAVDSIGFRKLEFFNLTNWEKQPRYFLENAHEFLDAPGEWFCNSEEGKIYYIPKAGERINEMEAIIPVSSKLLTITGDFETREQAGYVNFEGIIFEHTSWQIPERGYCAAQACFYDDRINNGETWAVVPPAIELNLASSCSFTNCVIRHTGGSGIWIHEQCVDCTISKSHIYDISGNGVNIGEGRDRIYQGKSWWQYAGEQVSENNKLSSSLIEDCGMQFYGSVGIWAGLVAKTTIQFNEVRNLPYTGISLGWMWSPVPTPSRENIIDANHIHHIMNELSDGGGIYNLGLQPGSRMSNNLIHDVKVNVGRAPSNGMFLDEGITDVVVENNIIYNIAKSPLRFHKATTNIIRDNVLVCGEGIEAFRYNNTKEEDIKKIDNVILQHSSESDMIELRSFVKKWHKTYKSTLAYDQNLAPMASIEGKGTNPEAITDGIMQSADEGEWLTNTKAHWWGEIDFPEITLKWDDPQLISRIVIFDRPNLEHHAAACQLVFSDGSKEQIWAIPNDGSPRSVSFSPRSTDFVRIEIVDGLGDHIGLAEVQVFRDNNTSEDIAPVKQFTDWVSYVDPTIESGRGRWFFCVPGSRPFGLVSAAAHTRNKAQGGGGYNYNSTEILGFSQIHNWVMAGISLMPVTEDLIPNEGEQSWKSTFSHDTEIIEPGYHKLFLDRYQTQVEYTSTERVAFYRLIYNEENLAKLLVSLGGSMGPLSCVDGKAQFIGENLLAGSVGMTDRIWGGPEISHAYFVMELNSPITQMDAWKGASETLIDIKAFENPVSEERLKSDKQNYLFKNLPSEQAGVSLAYQVEPGDTVLIKIGISYTSLENARNNLQGECPHWDFDLVRNNSKEVWNDWLGKIKVKGGKEETRVKFYTDLWHVLLGRHKIDDLNGDYPNLIGETKISTLPKDLNGQVKFHMYNSDALWLTMWNLNVLWGIAWPEILDEFSASLVQYADNGGKLPRGPGSGGYTGIMTGCPATSMITATWQKGLLTKVNEEKAYQAMKTSQPQQIRGDERSPGLLVQGGFEYWALAQMAEEIGETQDLAEYYQWSEKWKVCYNPKHQLLMGEGVDDPLSGKGWIEANAWQGTFGVSHDIAGLSDLMGGKDSLAGKLNYAFEQASSKDFVFGYGGGYVSYANQPGCSGAHVFNHISKPWLSQYWVRRVSRQAYGGTNPNLGYGGHDEDQGQMGGVSALMKLGLFSLRGTSSKEPIYEITAPEFDEIEIELDPRYYSGDKFVIRTNGTPENNYYIQKARLNGNTLNNCWFNHSDFAKGGILELWVGPKANKKWGHSPIKLDE